MGIKIFKNVLCIYLIFVSFPVICVALDFHLLLEELLLTVCKVCLPSVNYFSFYLSGKICLFHWHFSSLCQWVQSFFIYWETIIEHLLHTRLYDFIHIFCKIYINTYISHRCVIMYVYTYVHELIRQGACGSVGHTSRVTISVACDKFYDKEVLRVILEYRGIYLTQSWYGRRTFFPLRE